MSTNTGPSQGRKAMHILAKCVQLRFQYDMWILCAPVKHGAHQLGIAQGGGQMKQGHATQANAPIGASAGRAPSVLREPMAIEHQFLFKVGLKKKRSLIELQREGS